MTENEVISKDGRHSPEDGFQNDISDYHPLKPFSATHHLSICDICLSRNTLEIAFHPMLEPFAALRTFLTGPKMAFNMIP